MRELKKLLLERANNLANLEKEYVNSGLQDPPEELVESWEVFGQVGPKDLIDYPSLIISNDISDSDNINESVKIITEAYLESKDRNYVSLLEVNKGKARQNYIVNSTGYEDAKSIADALRKDEFYLIREHFSYKIIKKGMKWVPALSTKTKELFSESADSDEERYYRVFGKKYKTLF